MDQTAAPDFIHIEEKRVICTGILFFVQAPPLSRPWNQCRKWLKPRGQSFISRRNSSVSRRNSSVSRRSSSVSRRNSSEKIQSTAPGIQSTAPGVQTTAPGVQTTVSSLRKGLVDICVTLVKEIGTLCRIFFRYGVKPDRPAGVVGEWSAACCRTSAVCLNLRWLKEV